MVKIQKQPFLLRKRAVNIVYKNLNKNKFTYRIRTYTVLDQAFGHVHFHVQGHS